MKDKQTLEKRLEKHPELRARIETILNIAEGKEKGPDTADSVEGRVIEEVRKLGQQVMQDWANEKVEKETKGVKQERPKSQILKKKESIGKQPSVE